ncbi:hypothetical protein [Deefgea rivuli]|uniref:hypothetical protein n=1 Tax=Deefgea rivuli TaxID=400948 RepID=UPI000483AB5B|nr:hypothetical protein [Deefgea rivuli]
MQIIIGNFPPATQIADVTELLVNQIGAPQPTEITLNEGLGINTIALIQYPADAPQALGDALVKKLDGHHYKGFDLKATVTHSFKE